MCWAASTHRAASQDNGQQSGPFRTTGGMDPSPTENVRSAATMLESEEQRLAAELNNLREQRAAVTEQLRSIRNGLAALRRSSKPKADPKTRLSRELVHAAVQRALESGPKSYAQLKTAVLAEAREAGVPGTGVHLILQQVVIDPQVEQVDGNYRRKRSAQSAS